MDVGALATSLIAGQTAKLQLAVAAKMMRMNAQSEASIAQLIDAVQKNGAQLAAAAAGFGGNLDITV